MVVCFFFFYVFFFQGEDGIRDLVRSRGLGDVYKRQLVGLTLLYIFQYEWIDSAVAILFGSYICYEGYKIVRKSVAGIMDEADSELLDSIITTLNKNREPNWIDIHNMRVIKYGANLHFDSHLTVPYYFTVKEAHDELEKVESIIHKPVSYTHLRAHETVLDLVCRLLLEKKNKKNNTNNT